MLGAPLHGFRTKYAGNPHLRIRFLVRQGPGVHMAIVKMFSLIAPRTGSCPRLDNEIVGFIEVFTIVGGIGVIEKLLAAGSTHPTSDQAATRDQVDLSEFLRHAQWMLDHR